MGFTSLAFCLFFPVVTAGYFLIPHRWRWAFLLVASAVFYMAFIPWYILILLLLIVVDYAAGLGIAKSEGRARTVWLWTSVAFNIGILAIFKYFNFFATTINDIFPHIPVPVPLLAFALPIGLSFHTFQSLSYVIEVHQKRQEPERHLGIYALYVLFYPQLVAGPIERPQHMLHQFKEPHWFEYARVVDGLRLMLRGFFKKIVIADSAAALVSPIFAAPGEFHGLPLILATVLFAIQIFGDFSGYTDIARGAAQVMGFKLMENFNLPYLATSIGDFWRRWHISLSTWFRDYVYTPLFLPLGGRMTFWKFARNTLIVFLLSGLWHGAAWTFVIWGGLHGFYLVMSRLTIKLRARIVALLRLSSFPRLHKALRIAITFSLVCLTFIFFRAPSVQDAWGMVMRLPVGIPEQLMEILGREAPLRTTLGMSGRMLLMLALSIAAYLAFLGFAKRTSASPAADRWRALVDGGMVLWLLLFGAFANVTFIYFQF